MQAIQRVAPFVAVSWKSPAISPTMKAVTPTAIRMSAFHVRGTRAFVPFGSSRALFMLVRRCKGRTRASATASWLPWRAYVEASHKAAGASPRPRGN